MKRLLIVLMAGASVTAASAQTPGASSGNEWPTYGHDRGGQRFSPLTQINPSNVANLKPAWVYHLKPADEEAPAAVNESDAAQARAEGVPSAAPGRGFGGRGGGNGLSQSETTPLVVNGVMYITSPYGRVVALDPLTGKEAWIFKLPSGDPATRGVEYWAGDAQTPAQIVVTTSDAKLFTLDAKTGQLNPAFGDNGVVDLNTPEILRGFQGSDGLSSPAIMYKNLIIVGGRTQEGPELGVAGDVRAWDIHTGKLVWTFHSVPLEGEPNYGTWAGDSGKNRSGVNVWGLMTVDTDRGIAYLPFGAPASDRYGGDREGTNLYDSSVVAVNANTGEYLWHFQVVHHDIWDFDLEAPPALIDIKRDGKTIPAVAVINKASLLFILDRVTGKPLYDVEERAVPASSVPLEKAWPTQPFPVKPAPLSRQTMTMDDIAKVTPELEAACRKYIADNNIELGGPYLPVSYDHQRVNFPSAIGGVNWGGTSFDPNLGYLFVNTSELGQVQGYRDPPPAVPGAPGRGGFGGRGGAPSEGANPYAGIPGGGRFKIPAPVNQMCNEPPWGALTAVDVSTGEFAWRVPLGITENLPADKQLTGRPNLGGSIATAGGLVFIGATDDSRFRAFDSRTGKEVWTYKLNGSAISVPSTYLGKDGKQYVVVTGTGGGFSEAPLTSDEITAFTLP